MIGARDPGNLGRLAALQRRLREARVPVAGVVEPTRRCNLRCVHCYVGAERSGPPAGLAELDTAAWCRLVDDIAAAGCLELAVSGGEPTLRADLPLLYERARRAGIAVTLFTNATRVDAELVALLRELPPAAIEVSVYGAEARTHDAVTGVAGSFRETLAGLGRLAGCGSPLVVKTVLMTLNLEEFDPMARLAADHGARWRFDPVLVPRLDGDRAPLSLRVPPEEAARRELADAARAREWRGCYEAGRDLPASPLLFTCGAGRSNFHVDPYGTLRPCVIARRPAADLLCAGFGEAWRALSAAVDRLTAPEGYRCATCDRRNICGLCPPLLELEGGAGGRVSDYLCALGDRRRELMYSLTP